VRQRDQRTPNPLVGEPRDALNECASRLALAATALTNHLEQGWLGGSLQAQPPGAALTAVVVGFRRVVDDLVAVAVVYDREAGAHWEDLGAVLGVTAEAVRARYREIPRAPADQPAQP
jgi:hypothetical protein